MAIRHTFAVKEVLAAHTARYVLTSLIILEQPASYAGRTLRWRILARQTISIALLTDSRHADERDSVAVDRRAGGSTIPLIRETVTRTLGTIIRLVLTGRAFVRTGIADQPVRVQRGAGRARVETVTIK